MEQNFSGHLYRRVGRTLLHPPQWARGGLLRSTLYAST
jgi:hypothetical protein